MKESEGLYRSFRFLRRLLIGTLVLVLGIALFGYLFFMRGVDIPDARALAERELTTGTLRFGEKVHRKAYVYMRRPADYFRGTNGVLAATDERLVFIGVAPKDNLESADAPPAIIVEEFVNDTLLDVDPRRVFFLSAAGLKVSGDGRSATFAATRAHRRGLDSLAAYVNGSHSALRELAAREARLRAKVRELVNAPLYYVVRRGDAISTIANTFGTTVEQLQAWNKLDGPRIRIGDRMVVKPPGPRPAPAAAAPPAPTTRR
ncbi:MAG TPA: LysM peptidoglycan-binding domain-containing protein [Gemmatimonadaceae bacterium]|nr:LysM peptidoglycan-binding domain-containing protein [Gemmatimonadaceae bacterium]